VNLHSRLAAKAAIAAAAAVLAGVSLTSCTAKESGSAHGGKGGPPEITVSSSDTACELSGTEAGTGPSTFVVTNNGTQVTEFYVYGEGDRVVGEVENISSSTRSRGRKRLYLRKDITVTHTQTGSLVGKCGQNVGTGNYCAA
jgi:hypothetical protein